MFSKKHACACVCASFSKVYSTLASYKRLDPRHLPGSAEVSQPIKFTLVCVFCFGATWTLSAKQIWNDISGQVKQQQQQKLFPSLPSISLFPFFTEAGKKQH